MKENKTDAKKSLRIAHIVTDIFFLLLIVLTILLPLLVTWYVEFKHRSPSLFATILVTCYPCAPFAGASLLFLRRLIKNARKGEIFSLSSIKCLKRISLCFITISVITIIAGRYYIPFYIVGTTFAFLSLLIFSIKAIFENVEI